MTIKVILILWCIGAVWYLFDTDEKYKASGLYEKWQREDGKTKWYIFRRLFFLCIVFWPYYLYLDTVNLVHWLRDEY